MKKEIDQDISGKEVFYQATSNFDHTFPLRFIVSNASFAASSRIFEGASLRWGREIDQEYMFFIDMKSVYKQPNTGQPKIEETFRAVIKELTSFRQ